MGKKDKDPIIDNYANLKKQIVQEKVTDVFSEHSKEWITKLEDI